MINTSSQVDYTLDYFGKPKDKEALERHGNRWNPYVNNSGTVISKIIIQ
jgi:hypothetical protein